MFVWVMFDYCLTEVFHFHYYLPTLLTHTILDAKFEGFLSLPLDRIDQY